MSNFFLRKITRFSVKDLIIVYCGFSLFLEVVNDYDYGYKHSLIVISDGGLLNIKYIFSN